MSNDLRQAALAAALQIAKPTQSSLDVILVAQAFLGFLSTDTKVETAPAKAAKAAPVKAAKPAPDPEPEAAEPTGPTAEDVGKKINELLAADKQPEALAALKKYGAKSKSTLPVEHYGDFIADADKILMDA